MEFENGVPVASRADSANRFVERFAGELRVGGAVGEMKVDVIAGEVITIAASWILVDNAF